MAKKNEDTKQNKSDLIKQTSDETDQVRNFILILIGVAVVTFGLYFLSSHYLVKDGVKKDNTNTEEEIAYNNVNVGTVFNRIEDEYYVFAFDPSSLKASTYSMILNTVDTKKKRVYFMDLSVDVNKAYVKEESNSKATKATELALKDPTLIMIKDGKIAKYIENVDDIEKELK